MIEGFGRKFVGRLDSRVLIRVAEREKDTERERERDLSRQGITSDLLLL